MAVSVAAWADPGPEVGRGPPPRAGSCLRLGSRRHRVPPRTSRHGRQACSAHLERSHGMSGRKFLDRRKFIGLGGALTALVLTAGTAAVTLLASAPPARAAGTGTGYLHTSGN